MSRATRESSGGRSAPPGEEAGGLRFRIGLLIALLVLTGLSFVGAPASSGDLALHHIPTALFVAWLVVSHGRSRLDDASYALIFVFLVIHLVGARYLYSNVPYEEWSQALFGVGIDETFGFSRNHYDRFVHLAFGALMVHPGRRIFEGRLGCGRTMGLVLSVGLVVVCGAIYELIEWLIAVLLSPETAENYNGQQGDVWDAQKDMAIALVGAAAAAIIEGLCAARGQSGAAGSGRESGCGRVAPVE